jgi:hypothetical protein
MDLAGQMLKMLQARSSQARPLTISDFAREFGASPRAVSDAGRTLVDKGLAIASMRPVQGVEKLHGLLPVQPAALAK